MADLSLDYTITQSRRTQSHKVGYCHWKLLTQKQLKEFLNLLVLAYMCGSLEAFLCAGSKAPGFADCSQLTTYLVAFQCLNGDPLISTIIKSLTESASNLFLGAVWYKFIWLNPRSHSVDDMGSTSSNVISLFNLTPTTPSSCTLWNLSLIHISEPTRPY